MYSHYKGSYESLLPRIQHLDMDMWLDSWLHSLSCLEIPKWRRPVKTTQVHEDLVEEGFTPVCKSCINTTTLSWLMFSGSLINLLLPFERLYLDSEVMRHSKILYNGIHNEFLDYRLKNSCIFYVQPYFYVTLSEYSRVNCHGLNPPKECSNKFSGATVIASPWNANEYDGYGKASHQPLTISQKNTSHADTNLLIVIEWKACKLCTK